MLSPAARRLAGELAEAIDDGDTRRARDLVAAYGLPREQRLGVCRELDRPEAGAVALRFDRFDRARIEAA